MSELSDNPVSPALPAASPQAAIPPAEPPGPALVDLLLRPDAFFARSHPPWRWYTKLGAIILLGVAAAIDRLDTVQAMGKSTGRDWPGYWGVALSMALFAGPVRWLLGGYWYRVRLRLCGARKLDRPKAQQLFVLSDLVQAIPTVAVTLLATLTTADPDASESWVISVLALIWSVLVSYRGARAAFPLSIAKARFWFLVMPVVFFLFLVAREIWKR